MSAGFDIKKKAADVLSGGRVVEAEKLSVDTGIFDAEDADALIEGGMQNGGTARGRRSLVVRGNVQGTQGQVCRLAFEGDVVVTGHVRFAHISGRHIWIGGGVSDSQLASRESMGIVGMVRQSDALVGDLGLAQQQMRTICEVIRRQTEQLERYRQQLELEERRVEKMIRATKFQFAFAAGGIVARTRTRVRVNLKRFYAALNDKSADEVDRALKEFFNRAVVGLMTRNNHHLIRNNYNRRNVFMGLIKALHSLFMLTRLCDRLKDEVSHRETQVTNWTDLLQSRTVSLSLGGGVVAPMRCEFAAPEVKLLPENEFTLVVRSAQLKVEPGETTGQVLVRAIGLDGSEQQIDVASEAFCGVVVQLIDGFAQWKAIETTEEPSGDPPT